MWTVYADSHTRFRGRTAGTENTGEDSLLGKLWGQRCSGPVLRHACSSLLNQISGQAPSLCTEVIWWCGYETVCLSGEGEDICACRTTGILVTVVRKPFPIALPDYSAAGNRKRLGEAEQYLSALLPVAEFRAIHSLGVKKPVICPPRLYRSGVWRVLRSRPWGSGRCSF